MLFSSNVFIYIFLPAVFLAYYALRRTPLKNYVLFAASLLFYAWGEPLYVFLMIISITGNFVFGRLLGKAQKKPLKVLLLVLAVILNLSALAVFKYGNFALTNVNRLFSLSLPLMNLSLPIGISFYTFQGLSYIIDVYRGDVEPQKNYVKLGLYISFFPQLIAGPILRYETVCEQIENRTESWDKISLGAERFIFGLSKKMLLANVLSVAADKAFALAETGGLSTAMAWLGAMSFTFQIYFDFSGYSDMAIGLGKMFGFEFPENFDYPYISSSVSEFWRRWHISLGTWFRDYVYFPLGGSRTTKPKMVRNLAIVWFLTGVWHGADWSFILWGSLYGVIIIFEKLTGLHQKEHKKPVKLLFTLVTFFLVVLGWVLFGATSITSAAHQLAAMFGRTQLGLVDNTFIRYLCDNYYILILSALFSTPLFKTVRQKLGARITSPAVKAVIKTVVLILLLALCCVRIVASEYNPFLYFNF